MNPEYNLIDEFNARGIYQLVRRENEALEKILREYIDHPIVGEITKEKLKYSGVCGIIKRKDFVLPEQEEIENGFRYTITSDILGLSQGDFLIQPNGNRIPLDEIPCKWYEERFVYDN